MKAKGAFTLILAALLTGKNGTAVPACYAYPSAHLQAQGSASGQSAIAKSIGTIKAINGNAITLTPASGPEVAVTVQPTARLLRLASGDKDLKNASTIQVQDLQVGDTIRVRGFASGDGKALAALEVIVITHAAVAAVSDQIRQDWQKRGVGGMVDSVDAAGGTVNISIPGLAGKRTIVVHTTPRTVIYRYAPDSARPEDAKTIPLQGIQLGDQLRARGNRSADGNELAAEEIYTGVFPKFIGTIRAIDASTGTFSVQDLATKKTVQVRVTADSQLHKLPAEMAQRFAMRLKGGMAGAGGASPSGAPAGSSPQPAAAAAAPATGSGGGTNSDSNGLNGNSKPGSMRTGGAPDFQTIVSRLPSSTLAELNLQKGDAVVVLATEGSPTSAPTAITLLSGVEPILEAAPNASQAMMLSPWSLGGAPNGDAGNP